MPHSRTATLTGLARLKMVLAVTLAILAIGNTTAVAQTDIASADLQPLFEMEVSPPTAKPGEYVLCPSRQFYDAAVEKGVDKTTFIYYAAKMVKVGQQASTMKNLAGQTFELPNQLIISLQPDSRCQVGDILLTWWQTGSGMQRAIVVGGDDEQPIVRYLDIRLDNPSGAGQKEDTLKPNSFVVLNNKWQIGSAVAVKDGRRLRHGLLLAASKDRILVREFAGKLKAYDREQAFPVPIIPDFAEGDIAMAMLYGSFKPVTVTKIDRQIGRVFADFQLGRKSQSKVFAFGDIYKKNKTK